MDQQTGHLGDRYHARIILLTSFSMKYFWIFSESIFSKNCILGEILTQENQEAFSESCSLISGALQGLVKICKKYMEVNHFLLLIYSLEK